MNRNSETDRKSRTTTTEEEIDFSEIAELGEDFFREAIWHPPAKKPVTIRIDEDVLDWFRGQGPGYQTRINRLLRKFMEVNRRNE